VGTKLKQKDIGTKSKSTQWYLIVTLACGIAIPRGTNNATCHTGTWHVAF